VGSSPTPATKKNKDMKEKFENIVNEYIKKFCKYYGLQFDGWIGDDIGGVAQMSDYFFNFQDIRYFYDNKTDWKIIINWYDYVLEYGFIKKEAYLSFWYSSPEIITEENFNEHLNKLLNKKSKRYFIISYIVSKKDGFFDFGTLGKITDGEYLNLKEFLNTIGIQSIITNIVELNKTDYENFLK
jgi:hypothetical protein